MGTGMTLDFSLPASDEIFLKNGGRFLVTLRSGLIQNFYLGVLR